MTISLPKDANRVTVIGGTSSADGVSPVTIYVDPSTHRLLVDASGGSSGITIGSTTITSGTDKGILYDNAGVVGNYTPDASLILATDASKNVQGLDTATYPSLTELSYLKGVTSAIQTQLDAKGTGTVTSVASGNGMNFTTITGTGTVTMGTPSTLTVSTTNALTTTSHTHAITSSSAPGAAASLLATDSSGIIGSTGTRIVKIWATDLTVTNAISGSITGNAATVTTNANLTGAITSSGNATSLGSFSSANLISALSDETGTGVAVFNNKPTFLGTIQTITAVAALDLDGSLGNMFTKTIGTGSTFTQSNFTTGQNFVVIITGAFTITWFSGITWLTSGGTAPTQGAITAYGFTCTGSNTFLGYLMATQ